MYKRATINESVQPRFLDIEEFMKLKALRRLARPGINKGYKIYFEQYISAYTIRHVGIESFQRTGYSEVERAVLGW